MPSECELQTIIKFLQKSMDSLTKQSLMVTTNKINFATSRPDLRQR